MKSLRIITASVLSAIIIPLVIAGCAYTGENPKPPTSLEQSIFDVSPSTNFVQEISVVKSTNDDGAVIITSTTNTVPKIGSKLKTSEVTSSTVTTISGVVNAFAPGVGTLLGAGLAGALAAWAKMRSQKNAAPVLAQNIETILEFIKTLPDGQKVHDIITQFLYDHQRETGAVNVIAGLINQYVSNPDAKSAAAEIQAAIAELNSQKSTPLS